MTRSFCRKYSVVYWYKLLLLECIFWAFWEVVACSYYLSEHCMMYLIFRYCVSLDYRGVNYKSLDKKLACHQIGFCPSLCMPWHVFSTNHADLLIFKQELTPLEIGNCAQVRNPMPNWLRSSPKPRPPMHNRDRPPPTHLHETPKTLHA